jgi:hypothetical protein
VSTSKASSSGWDANPPSTPFANAGPRIPSRKLSQLSFDSWMATIVQPPPAPGPAAWKICPSGSCPWPGCTAASEASYCSFVPPGK